MLATNALSFTTTIFFIRDLFYYLPSERYQGDFGFYSVTEEWKEVHVDFVLKTSGLLIFVEVIVDLL